MSKKAIERNLSHLSKMSILRNYTNIARDEQLLGCLQRIEEIVRVVKPFLVKRNIQGAADEIWNKFILLVQCMNVFTLLNILMTLCFIRGKKKTGEIKQLIQSYWTFVYQSLHSMPPSRNEEFIIVCNLPVLFKIIKSQMKPLIELIDKLCQKSACLSPHQERIFKDDSEILTKMIDNADHNSRLNCDSYLTDSRLIALM